MVIVLNDGDPVCEIYPVRVSEAGGCDSRRARSTIVGTRATEMQCSVDSLCPLYEEALEIRRLADNRVRMSVVRKYRLPAHIEAEELEMVLHGRALYLTNDLGVTTEIRRPLALDRLRPETIWLDSSRGWLLVHPNCIHDHVEIVPDSAAARFVLRVRTLCAGCRPFARFTRSGEIVFLPLFQAAGDETVSEWDFIRSDRHFPLPALEPFPAAQAAALCLTDHADFDRVETLEPVFYGSDNPPWEGLNALGIRLTKSVFTREHPGGQAKGLDDPRFFKFVSSIGILGNEIAAHGLNPTTCKLVDLTEDLDLLRKIGATTLIDHGPLIPRNTSQEGCDPSSPSFVLMDLESIGIRNLWSYVDLYALSLGDAISHRVSPRGKSACLIRQTLRQLVDVRLPLGERLLHSIEKLAGLGVRSNLKKIYYAMRTITGRFRAESLPHGHDISMRSIPRFLRDILLSLLGRNGRTPGLPNRFTACSSWVYSRKFPGQAGGHHIFNCFSTIRVSNLASQINSSSIDSLLERRSLAILHLYLGGMARNTSGGKTFLPGGFADAMRHAARRRDSEALWIPTLDELSSHMTRWENIRLRPVDSSCIELYNRGPHQANVVLSINSASAPIISLDGEPKEARRVNRRWIWEFILPSAQSRTCHCEVSSAS